MTRPTVQKYTQQGQSTLFRYVITECAREKDDYKQPEMELEKFIQSFLERGVKQGEKDGSGMIGATFKPHSRLEQKNVESVTALILDVDGKFKRDGVEVIEPVDPDWFIGKLPFRGIAHASYNHSPAHPKFRVIFPLERAITVEEHRRLWAWAFDKVEKKCDPSCKNPDRMFFLARASAEALEAGWPWVRELRGQVLSIDAVPATFNMPASALATPKKKQGMHFAGPDTRFAKTDGHVLLENFMETLLVKWATEYPSAVSREVWRGIATNLAAIALEQEGDEDLFNECLSAFHNISEQDSDRYTASATTRTFQDALKSAREYGPMTFGRMAESGAPDAVCVGGDKTPIAAARRAALSREPDARGEVSGRRDGAQPADECTQARPGTGTPPLVAATSQPDVREDDEEESILDHKPEDFLFDTQKSGYLMRSHSGDWEPEPIPKQSFDQMLKTWGCHPKSVEAFKNQIVFFTKRKPFYDKPTEHRVTVDGISCFNTYKPSKLVPAPGNWDDIRALVLNLVGDDPKALEYILDWIATPLQSLRNNGKPMKMGVAPVFQGEQGSGKGTFELVMGLLYGASNCATLSQDALDNRFNGELIDKLFVTANEVVSSSNRSMETANKLKMWVTDPFIPIEEKFEGMILRDNNFNIMFTSNDDRPVIVEKTDRRYPVFRSKKLNRTASARIHQDLVGPKKQVAAFFEFLLARQSKMQFGEMFETEARREVMAASMKSEERFAEDVKEQGWRAVAESWRAAGNPNNPRQSTLDDDGVTAATIKEVYQDYCKREGIQPRSAQVVMKALRVQIPDLELDGNKRIGGVTARIWYGFPMNPPGDVIPFPTPAEPESSKKESDAGEFTVAR